MMMQGGSPTPPGPEPPTPGPLPSGYLECDWIASANNCYINTGIYPKADYSVEIVAKYYKYANDGYQALFGTRDGDNSWFTIRDNNNVTQLNFNRSTNAGVANESYSYSINRSERANNWKTYGIYKNLAKIDGTTVNTFSNSTGSTAFPYPLFLLAMNNANSSIINYCYQYVKAAKIWDENDTLVRDYIPAYEVSTSKFGLWDKVTSTFHPSDSANDFIGNLRNITLPSGYTQLDFVRFTGSQRIEFTETVKSTDCFEMDFKFNDLTKQQRVFAVENRRADLYINGSTQMAFNWGASTISKSLSVAADYGHVYCKHDGYAKSLYIDCHATTKTQSLSSYTAYEDKTAWWIGEWGTISNPWPRMDLYSFKKYENNVLVRNLIPCKNPSDVYGLYDILKNEFLPSSEATALQGGFIKD